VARVTRSCLSDPLKARLEERKAVLEPGQGDQYKVPGDCTYERNMGLSRRNALVGIGGLIAGGGALVGTGAFTTVQAERTVNVSTAGDASAFLALSPARNDNSYVVDTSAQNTGDTIEIQLDGTDSNNGNADGLNQNARTRFENLVDVTNNGTQDVESLELGITVSTSDGDVDDHEQVPC
jgi:hypothetical protein